MYIYHAISQTYRCITEFLKSKDVPLAFQCHYRAGGRTTPYRSSQASCSSWMGWPVPIATSTGRRVWEHSRYGSQSVRTFQVRAAECGIIPGPGYSASEYSRFGLQCVGIFQVRAPCTAWDSHRYFLPNEGTFKVRATVYGSSPGTSNEVWERSRNRQKSVQ